MYTKVMSAGVFGMNAYPVEVEVDTFRGLPSFEIVGLPDAAVKESRDRVRAAFQNCGFEFPVQKITVNLAPADLKKTGPSTTCPCFWGSWPPRGRPTPTFPAAFSWGS